MKSASAVRGRHSNGIGPETSDCMLLYAGGHPSFLIDTYTKRIFTRHGWCETEATYPELQATCTTALGKRTAVQQLDYWQDYHAQLVEIGKRYCRPRDPRCQKCLLSPLLPDGRTPPIANKH